MKKILICFIVNFSVVFVSAQSITTRIGNAYKAIENDSQLSNAISSLYVIDAKTGKVLFDKNSKFGLAPASTQKIITAATAYELLGKDFRYKTFIGYDIGISNGELLGNLYFEGNGDPTLGSLRWKQTKDSFILRKIISVLQNHQVSKINGDIWIDDSRFGINPVPNGWIWEDIGNYYGAGCWGFNWRENQYDLVLKPSFPGELTEVVRTEPEMYDYNLGNLIKTGEKGSGDNGYIYMAPYSNKGFSTGSIPAGSNSFSISGSMPHPARQFGYSLNRLFKKENIRFDKVIRLYSDSLFERRPVRKMMQLLDSIVSPSLDSINYWFLKKSINLYGECLLRTFALKKEFVGLPEKGISAVKDFWKTQGIPLTEINIVDGSGLSPLNRVTTNAQVKILQYAKKQSWFPGYFDAFPEYNGMKMKSGTIGGVKAFCGYHKSKAGQEYIFSFIVNNYNGSSSALVQKMYKVLDELK